MSRLILKVLIFCELVAMVIKPSGTLGQKKSKANSFLPKRTRLSLYTGINWNLEESFIHNKWDVVRQAEFRNTTYWNGRLYLDITNRTSFGLKGEAENSWRNFYLCYRHQFKQDSSFLLKNGISTEVKVGWIEWTPSFNNAQLILENSEAFSNPDRFWGANFLVEAPLTIGRNVNIKLRGHTGDIIKRRVRYGIVDFHLNHVKMFGDRISTTTQIGLAQGSQHLVNFSYLTFKPNVEYLSAEIRIGKLPSIDRTPYGVHFNFKRKFKYIELGGYYEKRLNQDTRGHISGISWRIIGPPKLARVFNTFSLSYIFNTNTAIAYMPVFQVTIKGKV